MVAARALEIVNPVARVSAGAEIARKEVESVQGLRVGLLDNGQPHAGDFLRFVGGILAERYGVTIFERSKEGQSAGAGDEKLDALAAHADVAVTGFGI